MNAHSILQGTGTGSSVLKYRPLLAAAALALLLLPASGTTTYTLSTLPYWPFDYGISGVATTPYVDATVGQTFRINNGNALVSSITVPIYAYGNQPSAFQIGIARWDGTRATGSMLYLSERQIASGAIWTNITVNPLSLTLTQGEQFVLIATANSYFTYGAPVSTESMMGCVNQNYSDGDFCNLFGPYGISDLFTQDWTVQQTDMAFSISYQVVPEPSSLALLLAGGSILWRRRS